MPFELFWLWKQYPWTLGEFMCHAKMLTTETATYSSIFTIVAFTIERYNHKTLDVIFFSSIFQEHNIFADMSQFVILWYYPPQKCQEPKKLSLPLGCGVYFCHYLGCGSIRYLLTK